MKTAKPAAGDARRRRQRARSDAPLRSCSRCSRSRRRRSRRARTTRPTAPRPTPRRPQADVDDPLAKYFTALESMKLIDVESGNLESLRASSQIAEKLLTRRRVHERRGRALRDREVAALRVVHRLRRVSRTPSTISRSRSRVPAAYGASLEVIDGILKRGPAAPYWGPAHRRAVDIAIETRDHAGVLARLEAIKTARSDSAVGRRRAQLSARPRRVRRGQADRRAGRARADLEEEPAVLVARCTCAA